VQISLESNREASAGNLKAHIAVSHQIEIPFTQALFLLDTHTDRNLDHHNRSLAPSHGVDHGVQRFSA
jgi:hypothetical protein